MSLRRAHGNAARFGRLAVTETPPIDELPIGKPEPARVESPGERGESGRFARGNGASRAGGKARAGKTRLASRLGLRTLPDEAAFQPYKRSAAAFRVAQCQALAKTVGGGICGPGPSSIVATAALALAWSRFLSDQAAETGDADAAIKAVRLGAESRAALRDAHALAAIEATARHSAGEGRDPLAALRARMDAVELPALVTAIDEELSE